MKNHNKYYKTSIETSCPEEKCCGKVIGEGYSDKFGDIIKFIWMECKSCDWNQYS
tara:strand:+ start:716 stop:880 length:165 start_codon:yes stop_codon:yes gene_type:complete